MLKPNKIEPYILITVAFFPMLLTFCYFILFAGAGSARVVYGVGKTIQFLLPLVWVGLVCRERFLLRRFSNLGVVESLAFGSAVFLAMVAAYYVVLRYDVLLPNSAATQKITDKLATFNANVPVFFVIVGVFYSLLHSGLEEYYWRWFLYRRLTKTMRWNYAAVLSSCGFMLHHVLILGTYFGFTHWVTWLGSIGCAVGGLYWCWSYKRFDNIYPLWISHGIIDAAIFVVGYLAIFSV